MKEEEQKEAKEIMIQKRGEGFNYEDCAILAGVTRITLNRWKRKDATFDTHLSQAYRNYKGKIVKKVIEKKPDVILERKWPKEYGAKQEPVNLYQFNIYNPDERQKRIAELRGRVDAIRGSGQSSK